MSAAVSPAASGAAVKPKEEMNGSKANSNSTTPVKSGQNQQQNAGGPGRGFQRKGRGGGVGGGGGRGAGGGPPGGMKNHLDRGNHSDRMQPTGDRQLDQWRSGALNGEFVRLIVILLSVHVLILMLVITHIAPSFARGQN